jgi:micrococcal nuclease
MLPFTQLLWKKQLFLSIFVILVIVFSVFSSLSYSINIYAIEGTSTPLLQPIIPFFMNPSPSYQLQSTGNTTTIGSSQSGPIPINNSITSSSSTVNTTGWNSVNTTLGIRFMVPTDWIPDQFESSSVGGRTTEPTTRGVNFTSPESNNSFFMVNVTDNGNNNSQTTLSEIADSITRSTQNITKENTTTLSGLPAYEIVSLREIQASLLNITDLITTGNDKLYHIQYGAEANDIASFSTFKDVLGTFKIDNAKSGSLNDTRTNQTQAQNLTSTSEEQEEQEDIDDMRSPPPKPLESPESQSNPESSGSLSMPQSPYGQSQPNMPLVPQYPSNQPMISSPYSPYNIQNPYVVPQNPVVPYPSVPLPTECQGLVGCFSGTVENVVDGDTIDITNGLNSDTVRLALVDTPERDEPGYEEARGFTQSQCITGTEILIDQDAGQPRDEFGRMLGVVYCGIINISNRISLNELLLQQGFAVILPEFCSQSEFSTTPWAQLYGCGQGGCEPSYPDVCIPPPPPQLICDDLDPRYRNFRVLPPDPHGFDGDNDGIGCEA